MECWVYHLVVTVVTSVLHPSCQVLVRFIIWIATIDTKQSTEHYNTFFQHKKSQRIIKNFLYVVL